MAVFLKERIVKTEGTEGWVSQNVQILLKSKPFGQILGLKELKAVFKHNNIISKTAF